MGTKGSDKCLMLVAHQTKKRNSLSTRDLGAGEWREFFSFEVPVILVDLLFSSEKKKHPNQSNTFLFYSTQLHKLLYVLQTSHPNTPPSATTDLCNFPGSHSWAEEKLHVMREVWRLFFLGPKCRLPVRLFVTPCYMIWKLESSICGFLVGGFVCVVWGCSRDCENRGLMEVG